MSVKAPSPARKTEGGETMSANAPKLLEKEMAAELRAAGWKRVGGGQTYQSPNSGICLRLKKAWQVMQARKAVLEFATMAVRLEAQDGE